MGSRKSTACPFYRRGDGRCGILAELKKLPPETFDIRGRFIPNKEVALLFNEADLLVLPYIEASQSGVLMMATPFGLPVVATDVGEIAAVVRSLKLGLVVPPCDHRALADAIAEIATQADLKQEFRRNAISALDGALSPAELASTAKEMYKQIWMISPTAARRRGQVRRSLDIFTGAASFESYVLRPTWASYS